MKTSSAAFRILAVVLALVSIAGLVYFRTGGRLFAEPAPQSEPEKSDVFMMGSKSAPVILFDGTQEFAPAENAPAATPSSGTPPDVLEPDDADSSFSVEINQQGFTPNFDKLAPQPATESKPAQP